MLTGRQVIDRIRMQERVRAQNIFNENFRNNLAAMKIKQEYDFIAKNIAESNFIADQQNRIDEHLAVKKERLELGYLGLFLKWLHELFGGKKC